MMSHPLLLSLLLSALPQEPETPELTQAPPLTLEAAIASITAEECADHVAVLADPLMQGRGTLTAGFERAAEYVESNLRAWGYEPAYGMDYRMPVSLNCLIGGERCAILLSLDGEESVRKLEIEKDFVPVLGSQELAARGEPIFVGYAIDAKKEKWVDIKGRSVKDKIVFAFSREPRADDPKSKTFDGEESTQYSEIRRKALTVEEAGGLGLVIIPDPGIEPDDSKPLAGMVPLVDDNKQAQRFLRRPRFAMPKIPVMSVSRDVAAEIFGKDMNEVWRSMDKRKKAQQLKARKSEVLLEVHWASEMRPTFNLAAVLRPEVPTEEVVVLGAHLDHVGFDVMSDSLRMVVRPGADDNASGSAALLEVAQALASSRPQVNVLLLWFCGEELGLLGSREYCRKPIFPHQSTIAMLNMDMVGRGEEEKINIGGLWDRPGWTDFVEAQHERIDSPLEMDNMQGRDLYARSDQFSFHREDVVGLFFFEADLNSNKDYHQPTDFADRIDGEKMAHIARLFTACAWALAYEGVRP